MCTTPRFELYARVPTIIPNDINPWVVDITHGYNHVCDKNIYGYPRIRKLYEVRGLKFKYLHTPFSKFEIITKHVHISASVGHMSYYYMQLEIVYGELYTFKKF